LIALRKESGSLGYGELRDTVAQAFATRAVAGKRVLCIIPDSTRSMPMPEMFRAVCEVVQGEVAQLDFLVALGTHPPMEGDVLNAWVGITAEERAGKYADVGLFNHEWDNPDALATIGTLTEDDVAELSGGLLREQVDVTLYKRVLDYDLVCIVGPVFPHEVVGFSGGNKYFFPGVAGADFLNFFHWLGALITNPVINGTKDTPVRRTIDRAAKMIPVDRLCFCLNVKGKECRAIFAGSPEEAWDAAADEASETHVAYTDRSYDSVLALCPEMYDEIWVAGKCMYKLEPVVADGGELIIYAPHVTEVSVTHGEHIKRIGYHTRDYFLADIEKYKDVPRGVLAHSTHVRGIGSMKDGVEKPRVDVILATGIPEEECRAINLGYRDPATINPDDWRDKEDVGKLLVPSAGEVLYRRLDKPFVVPRPNA
jgi:nickel-dependent lactate racemase